MPRDLPKYTHSWPRHIPWPPWTHTYASAQGLLSPDWGLPRAYLGQLGPKIGHITFEASLVTERSSQLRLTPVEQGLQVLHTALGHCELTIPLLVAESQEQRLAGSSYAAGAQGGPRIVHFYLWAGPFNSQGLTAPLLSGKGAWPVST